MRPKSYAVIAPAYENDGGCSGPLQAQFSNSSAVDPLPAIKTSPFGSGTARAPAGGAVVQPGSLEKRRVFGLNTSASA